MLANTPIETYRLNGIKVYVKREDLVSMEPDLPPLAKIRGINKVLESLYVQGDKTVGVLDTKVSKAGWGTAAMAREWGLKCILGVPRLPDGSLPYGAVRAKELGAELFEMQSARYSIMYARLKRHVNEQGGITLPLGLRCKETALEVAKVVEKMDGELFGGSLIVCSGTGTILSGIIRGLHIIPQRAISVSAGMSPKKQAKTIRDFAGDSAGFMLAFPRLELLPAIKPYYNIASIEPPFPSHPNYDAKAWEWLVDHIQELPQPILFWNIGA